MRTDGSRDKECWAFDYTTIFNYLSYRSDLISQLLNWLNLSRREAIYYADPIRFSDYETSPLDDCGVVRVGNADKPFNQARGQKSKVTELSLYQFMALLSDVGGILKILSLLSSLITGYFHSRWVMSELVKVHNNVEYILSYEGLTGLFEDVQKLKRIMLNYILERLSTHSERIDELEELVERKDGRIKKLESTVSE